MASTGKNHGLMFTADPYSKIIDIEDKGTSLLFGDAATVTYLNRNPIIKSNQFDFGTYGKGYEQLICRENKLKMNGRKIFNYAAKYVPLSIEKLLDKNNLTFEEIDIFLFHQGSKYITDFLIKRIGLPKEKVPYVIQNYGNTVSSSIPIMLKSVLHDKAIDRALISGFGVGFSWASAILERI
jgi:3-oxoacyl-[acyl-carrier-protein] synthase-3